MVVETARKFLDEEKAYIPVVITLVVTKHQKEPWKDAHMYEKMRKDDLIRLQKEGYDLFASKNDGYMTFYGYLTPKQIENFPANPDLGYDIVYNCFYPITAENTIFE